MLILPIALSPATSPTSMLLRAPLLVLALVGTPAIAAISDGMDVRLPGIPLMAKPRSEAGSGGVSVVPLESSRLGAYWDGSIGTSSTGAGNHVDLMGGTQSFLAGGIAPPRAAAGSQFPMVAATGKTAMSPSVAPERSAPRVLFGGLGTALVFGLMVLAGINSRKRWPNLLGLRAS